MRSNRAEHLLATLVKAIQIEADIAIAEAVDQDTIWIKGMTVPQILALRKRFINDTNLLPEKLTVEQIEHRGSHE